MVSEQLVDLSRLPTYAASLGGVGEALGPREWTLVAVGASCAFAGALVGVRYLKKVTLGVVRLIVVALMFLIGAALMAGVIGS